MKIKEITWRNICSYGNIENNITFDEQGGLWQICGESGAGKSTILTMPKLALFQKIDSNIDAIANRINKNGYIKCVVESDNHEYTIIRGYDPNDFELSKDGVPFENATKKGKEEIIRNEILKNIPVDVINNVIILSLNHFVSFTNMKNSDKKDIINNIIDISSIDDADVKLTALIKNEVLKFNSLDSEIKKLEFGNSGDKSNLERLEASQTSISEYHTADVGELDTKIEQCDTQIQDIESRITQSTTNQQNCLKIVNEGNGRLHQINSRLGVINSEIQLYESGMCPTCHRAIDMSDAGIMTHHTENIEKSRKLVEAYKECKAIVDEHNTKYNNSGIAINAYRNEYNLAISAKSTYTAMKSNIEAYQSITDNIKVLRDKISANEIIINSKKEELVKQERIITILRDRLKFLYGINGVKKQLYGSVIPVLNSEISKVLTHISFPYTMDFDDMFDAHIYHMGEEIPHTTLSEGEGKKVDICVICAMIKLIKNKFPQLNVLCLDETLSSLDYKSSVNILTYLKNLAKELGINILVVSHTTLDESLFDHRIMISRDVDDFSIMTTL